MGKESRIASPEDSTWSPEGLQRLDEFEESRGLVLSATRQLLSDFYRQRFRGDERVLEVGSGTGFLKRVWSEESSGEWIELDSQLAFLGEARKRKFEGRYVGGSVYQLPFPDKTFDVVCGLSSYDVFADLEGAVKESHRVLREDGLFFHLLDLIPPAANFIDYLREEGLRFEIKQVSEDDGSIKSESISFIPQERLEGYNREAERAEQEFDARGDDDTIITEEFLERDRAIWEKYSQEIPLEEVFEKRLTEALASCFDPKTISVGTLTSQYCGPRTEQQRKGSGFFVFSNEVGTFAQDRDLTFYSLRRTQKRPSASQLICAILSSYHRLFYRGLSKLSPSLAQRIEPSSTEISVIRYAIARKGS